MDSSIGSTTTFNILHYTALSDSAQLIVFDDGTQVVNPGDTKYYFITASIDCNAAPGATFGIELDPDGSDTTTANDEETVLSDTNTGLAAVVREVANEPSFQITVELQPEITVTALDPVNDCVDNDGDWRDSAAYDLDLSGSPNCGDNAVDGLDNYGEQYVYTHDCTLHDTGYSKPQPDYYLTKFLIVTDSALVTNAEARIDKLGVEVYQSNDTGAAIDTSDSLAAADLKMAISFNDGIAWNEPLIDWIEDNADGSADGVFDVLAASAPWDTMTNDARTLWDNDTAGITVRLSVPCGTNDGRLMVKLILDPDPNSSSDGYVIDLNSDVDISDTTWDLDVASTYTIVERMTDLLVSTSDAAADTFNNDGDLATDEVDEEDVSKGQTDYTLLFNISDADTMQMNVDALVNRLDVVLTDVNGLNFTDSANVSISLDGGANWDTGNGAGLFTTAGLVGDTMIDGGDTAGIMLSDSLPIQVKFDIPDDPTVKDGPMNVCLKAYEGSPNPEELNTNTDVDTGPYGTLFACNQVIKLEERPRIYISSHPTFEVSQGQTNVGGDTIGYPLAFTVADTDPLINADAILHKMGIVIRDNADTSDTPATGALSGTVQIAFYDSSTWSGWISTDYDSFTATGIVVVHLHAWADVADTVDTPTKNEMRTIRDNESETVYVRFNTPADVATDTMCIKLTVDGDTYPLTETVIASLPDTQVWPTDANSGDTIPSPPSRLTDFLHSPIVETPAKIIISSIKAVDQVTGISNIIQIDASDSTVAVTVIFKN
ncbi:MAG: hypothetical protein KKD66_26635, partial [Proteobacteria bacterium]|nr:hypothetical protein [Pseudomonadota bacterium]